MGKVCSNAVLADLKSLWRGKLPLFNLYTVFPRLFRVPSQHLTFHLVLASGPTGTKVSNHSQVRKKAAMAASARKKSCVTTQRGELPQSQV